MAEPVHKMPPAPAKRVFKYPSEDEVFVRRLGSGLLNVWNELPPELQEKVLFQATLVWDREFNVSQLAQKLVAFIKRHPQRLT